MSNDKAANSGKQQQSKKNRKGKQKQEIKDLEKPIELNEESLESAKGGQDRWKPVAKIVSELP
ncbi:MAG: hypothetical protein KC777_09620 [Cyanobacteria bacterium HKST-UBA02]|nr:hypothetical protein [Cyanobacteria bacterium HKST-UBA02]